MEGIQLETINTKNFCTLKNKEMKTLKLKYQVLAVYPWASITNFCSQWDITNREKQRAMEQVAVCPALRINQCQHFAIFVLGS